MIMKKNQDCLSGGRKVGFEKAFLKIVKTKEMSEFPLSFLKINLQSIPVSPH